MAAAYKNLKLLISCFLFFLSVLGVAQAGQLDKIKERGKIVIGIKNDYKPFGFIGPGGQLEGFEIELARFIGRQITGSASQIELVPVVASNRIELLNQGRIDIIVATLGRTAERAKVIDYSNNYYMLGEGAILARKGSPIKTYADLQGKKLCGILGDDVNRTLASKYGARLVLFQGTAEMFKAFGDNRCDGIGYDEPPLRQRVADPSLGGKYAIVLAPKTFIPLAVGVRKNQPALLSAVNNAIRKAEGAGILVDAAKKYNMGPSKFLDDQESAAKAALKN